MKTMLILAASVLILTSGWTVAARAEDEVVHREIIEGTQPSVDQPVVIEKRTTIIEKKDRPVVDIDVGHGGIVSSTIDVAGEVLALPFKAVGDVFDLIF